MVLLLSPVEPNGEGRKTTRKETQYKFVSSAGTVAVIYDTEAEAPPSSEEVQHALQSVALATAPRFLVTPFNGLLDSTNSNQKNNVLTLLMTQIGNCVGKRENVTIVNRGVQGDKYLEQLMLKLLATIKTAAEYAMQVVADEIAKEKQMQRLLQLENEENNTVSKEARKLNYEESSMNLEKKHVLPLSKFLRKKIKELNMAYPYAQPENVHADDRYSVLSAAHGDDLTPPCTKGSRLVPAAFVMNPPTHRQAIAPSQASAREKNLRSHSYLFNQQKRRSTMAMLAQLQSENVESELVPLTGNGWGETVRYFVFDGESSVMALPGVPKFEDIVKSFSVDFWLRTDLQVSEGKRVLFQILDGQREDLGQLFQVSLNWYEDMEESIRIFCRDSTNRVMEALIPVKDTGLTTGKEFHHVMLHVYSMDEGQLECTIDGKAVTVQLMQQEHAIAFNSWPHRLFVGGYLDENNMPSLVFRGTIIELRFWAISEGTRPVVRWPLMVEEGKLVEMTRTIPAEHHETLQSLQRVEEAAPRCSPYFDGNLVLNMGTLSLWGELMQNWRLEIRFRTDVSSRMMTLVGVMDQQCKMQELGIVLNAEPVVSKERFRYHELNTTFYVVDAFGQCCSALLRGTERQNLMDGEWHTLVWRCVDSEANKFSVKVDGALQDLLYVSREGPHRFVEFKDWVCVGGHNLRNWKVLRPFTGQISRFFVSVRGYRFVTLHMNEGPGAYVLQDKSGHCNHGLLVHPETGVVRKNDTIWMPAQDESLNDGEVGTKVDVVIFANNHVSVAAVVFTCDFDESGIVHEVLYDVFQGRNWEVEVVEKHISDDRAEWGTWRAIPTQCFRPLETVTQLEEAVNAVLASKLPSGHLMFVVRIGDCHVTLLHVRDTQLPPEATYNTNMLKWHYPFMVEGTLGRRELLLNRMIEGVETVLMHDTMTPFTTARLGPANASGKTIISGEIIKLLQDSGRPWFLPAVLHNYLLNAEYGSNLHIIHHLRPTMSFDEAAALALFNRRLYDGAEEKASIVIQRNWRQRLAMEEAARREAERQIRDRKVEEVRTTRMNPMVQSKQELYALIVTLHNPHCGAVPPVMSSTHELEDALRRQGYEVDRLDDPSLATLMRAVSHVDTDKSCFIYISGYGGLMSIRQPPLFGLQALHMQLQEGAARAGIVAEAGSMFRSMMATFTEEKAGIKPRRQKKKKAAAAAARPKKMTADQVEAAARQLEAAFHSAQLEVEQEESYSRDDMMHEYSTDVQLLTREMRHAIVATREFEIKYKTRSGGDSSPRSQKQHKQPARPGYYIYPCESERVEPYANGVVELGEVLHAALHRQAPPAGLQCIVAVDLQPVTPYSRGVACLASSTGNTLYMPYRPQQRRLLSWILWKAFVGHVPQISSTSKYAVLSGGIETAEDQRDWKSFATYVVEKMKPTCDPQDHRALCNELAREMQFTAELVPVRDIVMPPDVRDRLRRDRETQKVCAELTFGVGSIKVQSDMFALFKGIVENLPLSEITFTNRINVLFAKNNKGIDGINVADLRKEIERTRPRDCTIPIAIKVTADGAQLTFETKDAADKLNITQWLSSMVIRSMSWQIGINPLEGYGKLDVEYLEYVFTVKTTCHMRRFRKLKKQWYVQPVPEAYIRFLKCELV